jgi:hypothetical protein
LGVRGRRSDNRLIKTKLGWEPTGKLQLGIERTYSWIEKQMFRNSKSNAPGTGKIDNTMRLASSIGNVSEMLVVAEGEAFK